MYLRISVLVQIDDDDDGVGVANDFRPMKRGKSKKKLKRKKYIDINEGKHLRVSEKAEYVGCNLWYV